jgi:hypothetical protein
MRRGHLADVHGAGGESHALADTDKDTAGDEGSELVPRGKGLDKGSNDGNEASDPHSPSSSEVICGRAAEEESGNNGTDCVGRVDQADQVCVSFLRSQS